MTIVFQPSPQCRRYLGRGSSRQHAVWGHEIALCVLMSLVSGRAALSKVQSNGEWDLEASPGSLALGGGGLGRQGAYRNPSQSPVFSQHL